MTPAALLPTVVLDTNVILDWVVFVDPAVIAVTQAIAAGELLWLMAPRMRDELADVLLRPLWGRWHADPSSLLAIVDRNAHVCETPSPCGLVCVDPDDQVFIDLALAQRANWLLSRDKALLKLARPAALRGTVICQPARWAISTDATSTTSYRP